MIRKHSLALVLFAASVAGGCDKSPAAPGPADPAKPITTIRIEGPSSVAPGATAQFRAIAAYTDGTTSDVTASAAWSSFNPGVLRFGGAGSATGVTRGEVAITATLSGHSQTTGIFVLEPGTYRASGTVLDAGFGLPGAVVEVVSGTGTGLRAVTDSRGAFALYGVSGSVELQATADGFLPLKRATLADAHVVAEFALQPASPVPDLGGRWTLDVTASPACAGRLPPEAMAASFETTVTQQGTRATFNFGDATAEARLTGIVFVYLFGPENPQTHEIPPLLSRSLDGTRLLAIGAIARGTASQSEVRGTLDGTFHVMSGGVSTSSCHDRNHGFVLKK